MKNSLALKLLVYFVLLNFVSIIIMGSYAYTQAKTALLSRTFDQLTSVRIEKKKRVQDFFQHRIQEVQSVERLNYITDGDDQLDLLEQFKLRDPVISSLILNNQNFKALYIYEDDSLMMKVHLNEAHNRLIPEHISSKHRHLFDSLLHSSSTEVSIHEVLTAKSREAAEILLCKKVMHNQKPGVLAFSLALEKISGIMLDRNPLNGLGESGEAYMVGKDYLLRSTSRFEENSVYNIQAETEGVRHAFADSTGTSVISDYRGIRVLSSFSRIPLPDLEWVILAEIDYQEAMIPIRSYGISIIYISIILSLLLLGIVALLSNTITAPLRKLRKETEKISAGDYSPLENIPADGEIRDLILSYNHMLTKIKEQQENLRIARDKSISSMIDGQEIERTRLAMELHDGLAQTILAIKMKLENTAPEKATAVLAESQEMFTGLMYEIRSMSNDLMPAVLREFGLVKALESLLTQSERSTGIVCVLKTRGELGHLNKKAETYLYRIAQESMNNVIKHSGATQFRVKLQNLGEFLLFELKDNGSGLGCDSLHKNTNGMANIQERTSILGGKVYFYNAEPQGLLIQCKIPLKKCIDE